MKGAAGSGLVIIGFVFLWLAISGRLECFYQFVQCITSGKPNATNASGTPAVPTGFSFKLPSLPVLT